MGNSEFFPGRVIKAELIGQRVLLTSENGCTCYLHFCLMTLLELDLRQMGYTNLIIVLLSGVNSCQEEISLESKEFSDYFEVKQKLSF